MLSDVQLEKRVCRATVWLKYYVQASKDSSRPTKIQAPSHPLAARNADSKQSLTRKTHPKPPSAWTTAWPPPRLTQSIRPMSVGRKRRRSRGLYGDQKISQRCRWRSQCHRCRKNWTKSPTSSTSRTTPPPKIPTTSLTTRSSYPRQRPFPCSRRTFLVGAAWTATRMTDLISMSCRRRSPCCGNSVWITAIQNHVNSRSIQKT